MPPSTDPEDRGVKTVGRLPIVGVMGSGASSHDALARPLGHWLAGEGCHLLTGGGAGVMSAVSEAFASRLDRIGLVIGVLPGPGDDSHLESRPGYPNPWVEIPIRTHLPHSGVRGQDALSRNHINVLTCDLVIALPGSDGTRSEVELCLTYGRPVLAFLDDRHQIPHLPADVLVCRDLESLIAEVRPVLEAARARGMDGSNVPPS